MTDWFRSWHGAPTDPKWLGIAKRAGVAPGIAVAVAWALMDRASQSSERGSVVGYDADGLAYFFGCEPQQVDAIVTAMTEKGMLVEGRFVAWERRQPKREDDSSKRVKAHRERVATHEKRDVTQLNAPDTEESRGEEKEPSSLRSEGTRAQRASRSSEFDDWWKLYPHKVGKGAAEKAFAKARKLVPVDTLSAGVRAYASKTDDRPWCNPATWLNDRRWEDQPAGSEASSAPRQPQVEDETTWRKRLFYARNNLKWHEQVWGPPPFEDGCRVPAGMLEQADGKGWDIERSRNGMEVAH